MIQRLYPPLPWILRFAADPRDLVTAIRCRVLEGS
jgi:hypothetical protein